MNSLTPRRFGVGTHVAPAVVLTLVLTGCGAGPGSESPAGPSPQQDRRCAR